MKKPPKDYPVFLAIYQAGIMSADNALATQYKYYHYKLGCMADGDVGTATHDIGTSPNIGRPTNIIHH